MITDSLKGLLGICRKAGKMSIGHDAVVSSVKKRKSFLCITCCDASERLKKEVADECKFQNRNIPYIDADFNMQELSLCIGTKAGVISIDERGFADKLNSILRKN